MTRKRYTLSVLAAAAVAYPLSPAENVMPAQPHRPHHFSTPKVNEVLPTYQSLRAVGGPAPMSGSSDAVRVQPPATAFKDGEASK